MSLVQVDGFNSLRKDTATGGVVNVDKKSYEAHKAQKMIAVRNAQAQKSTQESVTMLQDEINILKADLVDIKTLLVKLIEKGN
jgi:hypothetical protein